MDKSTRRKLRVHLDKVKDILAEEITTTLKQMSILDWQLYYHHKRSTLKMNELALKGLRKTLEGAKYVIDEEIDDAPEKAWVLTWQLYHALEEYLDHE